MKNLYFQCVVVANEYRKRVETWLGFDRLLHHDPPRPHTQIHFSKERIETIKQLSERPDVYDRLARAVAPSVYEHDDIKKGILLQVCRSSSGCAAGLSLIFWL